MSGFVPVTRCPFCETTFRVTETQLNAARGAVRCGACLQVFVAPDHFVLADVLPDEPAASELLTDPGTSGEDLREVSEVECSPDPLQAVPASAGSDATPAFPSADVPAPVVGIWYPASNPTDTDPETAETADMEESPSGLSPINPDAPAGEDSGVSREDADTLTAGAPADEAPAVVVEETSAELVLSPFEEALPEDVRLDFELPGPELGSDDTGEHSRRWPWFVGCVALGLALMLQFAWVNRAVLANEPAMRPWVLTTCRALGCEVPEYSDTAALRAANLVIRSNPDGNRSLLVDAVIENRAPYRQAFPLLELRFASINQELVAARAFRPAEYLGGEMSGLKYIPGQTEVRISLEIVDPGPRAASYELSVF
ncbi:MAG: DUF3426 domain-containing protein [Pseudomonadota bacterium]